jgi:hypothetical protein
MANLFGMGGGAEVYLTVSQSCGLEMIEVGKDGHIKTYAQTPLAYNEALREIADYEEFKSALNEVFAKANINPANAMVHLSVPTVWFGSREEIPLILDEIQVGNIVLGELQKQYMFKTQTPIPYWFDNQVVQSSDSRNIFYTAIQANAAEQIKNAVASLGASLVSLECAMFAHLRGLHVTGIATKQMESEETWSLMIVNSTGFQLIDMLGKKISGCYEEAIPFKNYEGEEIYNAIDNAAQIAFMSSTSSSLVIISETDFVSAQVLSEKLQFGGQISYVEDNKFRIEPLMDLGLNVLAEDQLKVSLHAIGHFTPSKELRMPVEVNFLGDQGAAAASAVIETPFGQMTPQKATIIAAIILALVAALFFGISFLTKHLSDTTQAENEKIGAEIEAINQEIAQYNNGSDNKDFNPVTEIENVLKYNRTKIMAYAALGESIPKNIYLTYFLTGNDGKINIKGCAETVEDVYVFYKNLKDSLVESSLRINKLDLKEGSLDKVVNSTSSTVDDAPYVFEITNLTDDELKEFKDSLLESEKDPENTDEEQSSEDSGSGEENN